MVNLLCAYYDNIYYVTLGSPSHIAFLKMLYRHNKKNIIRPRGPFNVLISSKKITDYVDATIQRRPHPGTSKCRHIFNHINKIGTFYGLNNTTDVPTDNASNFYINAGIPPSVRLDYFNIDRDIESENLLYDKQITSRGILKYTVICQYDKNIINTKYITFKENIINLHFISTSCIDILKLVENAEEIHLIENSIALLIYYMQVSTGFCSNKTIFVHNYARPKQRQNANYITMVMHPQLPNWVILNE